MGTMIGETVNPDTKRQISKLDLRPERPLVICDVDEVVVHLLRGLEAFLDENGFWLDPASFALYGNVKRRGGHDPLSDNEVRDTMERFFHEKTRELDPIEGAADALNAISEHAEVVMLTNMPDIRRQDRISNLAGHGIHFPVIWNYGPKGPAVKCMSDAVKSPTVFIDDTPIQVESVEVHAPEVHILHFMQDVRFRRHLPVFKGIMASVNNWKEGLPHIYQAISVTG